MPSGDMSTPLPPQVFPARSTSVRSTKPSMATMEGKSLFTCHECGALLKFKSSDTSIEGKLKQFRDIAFTHPAPTSSETTEGEMDDSSSDETDISYLASRPKEDKALHPHAAIVPELVWEMQTKQQQLDGEHKWAPAPLDSVTGSAGFKSSNRGLVGQSINDVVPPRLLNKPRLWLSEWEVDRSVSVMDDEGWEYASDVESFGKEVEEPLARRRRWMRHRQIDGDDLSWFQELVDCSSFTMNKRTPSCHDCELVYLSSLQETFDKLQKEQEQYQAFISDSTTHVTTMEDDDDLDEDDDWKLTALELELEEEERQLATELSGLEAETWTLQRQREELWGTGKEMEELIHGTFSEGAFLQHLLGLSRDERHSVTVFSVQLSESLRMLQRYGVFNDCFHIWHDGVFGTINGLRLGRMPSKPVDWAEINAGIGHCVLLLATIVKRAGMAFPKSKLIPRGSFSRIVNMYGKEYNLYCDGGMFRRRGFNQAMSLLLECVDDAGKGAMRDDPSLRFPYKIQRGKIGDLSISLGNDEQWTKALKYMLTHLKWLVVWVSKKYPS